MKMLCSILTLLALFVTPAALWGALEPALDPVPGAGAPVPPPVPEPRPLLYVGAGLLALGVVLRRRNQAPDGQSELVA